MLALVLLVAAVAHASSSSSSSSLEGETNQLLSRRMNGNARTLLQKMPVKSITAPYAANHHEQKAAWKPSERNMEIVQQARSSLRVVNSNNDVNNVKHQMKSINMDETSNNAQRKLAFTGHVWDACIPDDTPTSAEVTAQAYDNVQYDDEHDPACVCWRDNLLNEVWMQCLMGDETCVDAATSNTDPNNANNTSTCSETQEIFLFSTNTGDLNVKNTCSFCNEYSNTTCDGVQEVCSVVFFDDNETPQQCLFQEVLDDGSPLNCEDCQICQGPNGETGMNYDCFGQSTNGQCDTTVSFHLHNFAPVLESGAAPVQGRFGDICRKNEEVALYDQTWYDNSFGKVCDCDDPTAGVIVCDLFLNVEDCFANECSPISEIFYFGLDSGELNEKVTCDGTNGLCSRVAFNDNDGAPSGCEVILLPDPRPCTSCNICQDEAGAYGIEFNCGTVETECLTSNGRAVNNFVDQPATSAPNVSANSNQEPPSSAPINTFSPNLSPASSEGQQAISSGEDSTPVGAIVGAFVGGLVLAGIAALLIGRKQNRTTDEDSAGATPSVVEAALNNNNEDDLELDETEPKDIPQIT
ncbi:unnamed protein product [Cylindrotheca closterium]|uniref:Uncharacterized protein n=1 Tax=Cylindrotheca closterium TaxID=2856 RepID=A0AAD2CL90_9STRA|nr:unnamed protein product [Cylindrotheca closterium]